MRIAFDFDETITNMLQPWLDFLNKKHGTNVQLEDCTCWEMDMIFPELSSVDIYEPLYRSSYWDTVVASPGMVELVNRLIDEGHEVYIATASHYRSLIPKFDNCLFKLLPDFDVGNVLIIRDKYLLDVDVLVDDNDKNLERFKGLKILIDRPYNRNTTQTDIHRVFCANEIYELICG